MLTSLIAGVRQIDLMYHHFSKSFTCVFLESSMQMVSTNCRSTTIRVVPLWYGLFNAVTSAPTLSETLCRCSFLLTMQQIVRHTAGIARRLLPSSSSGSFPPQQSQVLLLLLHNRCRLKFWKNDQDKFWNCTYIDVSEFAYFSWIFNSLQKRITLNHEYLKLLKKIKRNKDIDESV